MIIWSGWGVLVVVTFVGGMICGVMLTGLAASISPAILSFGPGLGLLFAALFNFLIGKLLYRGNDQILVDPRTGASYSRRPNHSLFFIPFRFFTWVFLVIGLVVFAMGFAAPSVTEFSKESQEKAKAIYSQTTNLRGDDMGNTREAAFAAEAFHNTIRDIDQEAFVSGGKKPRDTAKRNFTTLCIVQSDWILFATDVEDLSAYREVKGDLQTLAWRTAQLLSAGLQPKDETKLYVALRNGRSVESIQEGPVFGKPESTRTKLGTESTYHLFSDASLEVKPLSEFPDVEAGTSIAEVTPTEELPTETITVLPPEEESSEPEVAKTVPPREEAVPDAPATEDMKSEINGEEERTWTNLEGKSMVATFSRVEEGKAYFKKSDGVEYAFPLDQLSEADRKYIEMIEDAEK